MERFHYTIKQKLEILQLVETGQLFRLASQFPHVTQKQISDWMANREKMLKLSEEDRARMYILHQGPEIKYKELYQFLYQKVKDLREDRKAITVESLLRLAVVEEPEVKSLSPKGQTSLICRFMGYFNLSIREITGTSAFRPEQIPEEQKQTIDLFIAHYKQLIIQNLIPATNVYNMDQTSICYENHVSRTIDFKGSKEIPVESQLCSKKRLTLFSLLSASGDLYAQLLVYKGIKDAAIKREVEEYDDWFSRHTTQENGWCDIEVLEEWLLNVWWPLVGSDPRPKILIIDSYPLHQDIADLFRAFNTYVLFIPPGFTWVLQPLDLGFHKLLKDELKKQWVSDQGLFKGKEKDKRQIISRNLKEAWLKMADFDNKVFWEKAGLKHPSEEVEFEANRRQAAIQQEAEHQESQSSLMEIEYEK
jgi:uncharacterized protein (UPF0305 family)